jgi:hypothetical protein
MPACSGRAIAVLALVAASSGFAAAGDRDSIREHQVSEHAAMPARARNLRVGGPCAGHADDCTDVLQALLNGSTPASGGVVSFPAGHSVTRPLFIDGGGGNGIVPPGNGNDTRLQLTAGSVLEAKRWSYIGPTDRMLTISRAQSVTIIGYGATMRMWGGNRGAHGRPDYFNRTVSR